MHVCICWHMLTQRACSGNQAPLSAWKHSGWVMDDTDLAFAERPSSSVGTTHHNKSVFCLFSLNLMQEKSACPPLLPAMSRALLSSSSGSSQNLSFLRSCRMSFSRPSSSPLRRTEPLPPCCCPACYQTEMFAFCATFFTFFTTSL